MTSQERTTQVTAAELRSQTRQVLDLVEHSGMTVQVTRWGRVCAYVLPDGSIARPPGASPLWGAAMARAASEGTTVSAVVEDALRKYVGTVNLIAAGQLAPGDLISEPPGGKLARSVVPLRDGEVRFEKLDPAPRGNGCVHASPGTCTACLAEPEDQS